MNTGIAERLDFLMKLTDTRNAALGRALNFDASYISRIRSGKRGLPPSHPFVKPAAAYLARSVRADFQKNAILRELGLSCPWPETEAEAAALLASYLETDKAPGAAAIPHMPERANKAAGEGVASEVRLFYGAEGKRAATLCFLGALVADGRAHTLLLYSDEEMDWLYEDPDFARRWAGQMEALLQNGGSIRIIHTISRDANEMWEAVGKWLPLYLRGHIVPYYYPRLRDKVYRRTLFIAAGHSALISDTVTGQQDALDLLLREPQAVAALEQEFAAYLALCRPLMEIIPPERSEALPELLREYACAENPAAVAAIAGEAGFCMQERLGALVIRLEPPCVAFRLREPRMVAALQEYLSNPPTGAAPLRNCTPKELASRLMGGSGT